VRGPISTVGFNQLSGTRDVGNGRLRLEVSSTKAHSSMYKFTVPTHINVNKVTAVAMELNVRRGTRGAWQFGITKGNGSFKLASGNGQVAAGSWTMVKTVVSIASSDIVNRQITIEIRAVAANAVANEFMLLDSVDASVQWTA